MRLRAASEHLDPRARARAARAPRARGGRPGRPRGGDQAEAPRPLSSGARRVLPAPAALPPRAEHGGQARAEQHVRAGGGAAVGADVAAAGMFATDTDAPPEPSAMRCVPRFLAADEPARARACASSGTTRRRAGGGRGAPSAASTSSRSRPGTRRRRTRAARSARCAARASSSARAACGCRPASSTTGRCGTARRRRRRAPRAAASERARFGGERVGRGRGARVGTAARREGRGTGGGGFGLRASASARRERERERAGALSPDPVGRCGSGCTSTRAVGCGSRCVCFSARAPRQGRSARCTGGRAGRLPSEFAGRPAVPPSARARARDTPSTHAPR